jgi:polyhydroxyalkanoate synthesis regulator phasin
LNVVTGKNVHTTLKAAKEDTSAPGPSNIVINEKTSMPAVNKDTDMIQRFSTELAATRAEIANLRQQVAQFQGQAA